MNSIEETGKNVEEATEKALEQLGVTEDEVDVEILEDGAKGFLGIGQAPARVRVTLKEAPAAEPKPRAGRRRGPRPAPKPAPEPAKEIPPPPPPAPAKPKEVPPPAPVREAPPPVQEAAPAPVGAPVSLSEAAEVAREVLQMMLDALGNDGKAVVTSAADDQVILDMVGGDTPRLIGRHGQTVNAIQYLVGIVTNRRMEGRVRVVIDAEGYRARREDALRKQALQLAQQVRENGQEAILDSLTPNERRIIHTALADDPDVCTYSEGEDTDRHLVISPKK